MSLEGTYDAKDYSVIFADNIIRGYGEDTFITISSESPGMEDVVGSDGFVSRSRINDPRYRVEITLMASSASNDVLSALYAGDRAGVNGEGVAELSIVANVGSDAFRARTAWIMDDPDIELGRTIGERTWVFRVVMDDNEIGSLPSS